MRKLIFLCLTFVSLGTMAQVTVVDNTSSATTPATATELQTADAPQRLTGNYSPYNDEYDYAIRDGNWAIGLNFNAGLGDYSNVGLGLKLQHHATDAFRVEFGGEYYTENKEMIEWNLNMNFHYLIRVYQQMYVYPVIGVLFDHWHWTGGSNEGRIGAAFGAGYQYDITDRFAAIFEAKYKLVKDFNHTGLSLGIAYSF
ncbi:MAG: hypothetical protein J5486_09610 [Bacteroidaceae bacterium]|nr:hypothetical protein [Bacteroidaceae bacterium]